MVIVNNKNKESHNSAKNAKTTDWIGWRAVGRGVAGIEDDVKSLKYAHGAHVPIDMNLTKSKESDKKTRTKTNIKSNQ